MLKVDVFKFIKLKKKKNFYKDNHTFEKRKNKQGVAIPTQVFKN